MWIKPLLRYKLKIVRKKLVACGTVALLFYLLFKLYLRICNLHYFSNTRNILDIDDIDKVLTLTQKATVPIILFDPVVLERWYKSHLETSSPAELSCVYLCPTSGLLTLSVFAEDINDKPYYFTRLSRSGFTVIKFSNSDGLLSHIFLLHGGALMHICVLHWESSGYWMQFALSGHPHQMIIVKDYITIESWNILSVDRSYEKFEIEMSVIDGLEMMMPKDVARFIEHHKRSHFISCNELHANLHFSRYGEATTLKVTRLKNEAWKVLDKSKVILDQLGIPFWLNSGTCLGFFRQCDIIPWSLNVDLGIFIEDYHSALTKEFEKKGLKLVHRYGKRDDSFQLSFKEGEINVDLSFFYTEGGTMWHGATQANTRKKFKFVYPAFTLCWTEFLKLYVRIPCQTKDYIHANYGPNWKLPVKDWDWKTSPHNIQENGVWAQEEAGDVIFTMDT